jgi:prepilin-type N-terminal cleavage/methylation domain-containing protein/prepilin-type processing-associated H-X9-DG protein
MPRRNRSGFTLIEVLVVLGIIMILMAIILPAIEHVRHQAYRADCASNLRQVGQALVSYCNDNHGNYPRTKYVVGAPLTKGTGAAAADPFAVNGPDANDLTAPWFLLMRAQKLPPVLMLCPYNDVNVFEPDKANPMTRGNFTDYRKNLGYSFANPYPDAAALAGGYKLTGKTSASFAVAADLNPGMTRRGYDARMAVAGAAWSQMKLANSGNHEKGGQNVLYGDGHVDWKDNALVGVSGDNIYTNHMSQIEASPLTKDDSVLLPAE